MTSLAMPTEAPVSNWEENRRQRREDAQRFNVLVAKVAELEKWKGWAWNDYINVTGQALPAGTVFGWNAGSINIAIATAWSTRGWGIVKETAGNNKVFEGVLVAPSITVRTVGSGDIVKDDPVWLSAATAGLVTKTRPSTSGQFAQIIGYALADEKNSQVEISLCNPVENIRELTTAPGTGDPVIVGDTTSEDKTLRETQVGIDASGNIYTTGTIGILLPYVVGDLLQATTTSALGKLAAVATGNALISGGIGVVSSWGKIGLTTHISGVLAGVNGGTGLSTAAVGDIIYASATTPTWSRLAAVAVGQVLVSAGVNAAPAWSATPQISRIGLGVAAGTLAQITSTVTNTDLAGAWLALNYLLTHTTTSNNAQLFEGARFDIRSNPGNTIVNSGSVFGVRSIGRHVGSGTTSLIHGVSALGSNSGSGTATEMRLLNTEVVTNTGGGAITTLYGLYLSAQTVGGTNYAIWSNGTETVSIGGQVVSRGDGSSYGFVANDCQWYPDAANTWRTPDSVVIDVDLTVTGEILASAGADTAPSISFAGDPNTGAYNSGANQFSVAANGNERFRVLADGIMSFGTGVKAVDLDSAGGGIAIAEGSNCRMGTAVLVGGTVTVTNTSVTANTRIFLSRSTTGGTVGHLSTTQTAATSFVINSSSVLDTSTINWLLMEPS